MIGRITKIGGEQVPKRFEENLLIGVGWHQGHCLSCSHCRSGEFFACNGETFLPRATGITRDGGYAQYMVARWEALIIIPEEWSHDIPSCAPLLCAGLTVYNGLKAVSSSNSSSPSDVVLVHGIGGLGHLAIQFAAKLGYYTIAITSSLSKKEDALKLGAKEVFLSNSDQEDQRFQKRIKELGGIKIFLATAPDAKQISKSTEFLAPGGSIVVLAVPNENLSINPMILVSKKAKLIGWPSGVPYEAEETLKVASLSSIKPFVEIFPLEKAPDAYHAMTSNKVRFRAVIVPNSD